MRTLYATDTLNPTLIIASEAQDPLKSKGYAEIRNLIQLRRELVTEQALDFILAVAPYLSDRLNQAGRLINAHKIIPAGPNSH